MDSYQQMKDTAEQQEALLRFERFSSDIAWELGKFLAERVREKGIQLAMVIQKLNGHILFQYATEKTSLNNQNWLRRKCNTVALLECSSLKAWANSHISGEKIPDHGLSEKDYVLCGGGFPIRLKTGEMVGVVAVSNLPHVQDHQFVVEALSEWLSVENVPRI